MVGANSDVLWIGLQGLFEAFRSQFELVGSLVRQNGSVQQRCIFRFLLQLGQEGLCLLVSHPFHIIERRHFGRSSVGVQRRCNRGDCLAQEGDVAFVGAEPRKK